METIDACRERCRDDVDGVSRQKQDRVVRAARCMDQGCERQTFRASLRLGRRRLARLIGREMGIRVQLRAGLGQHEHENEQYPCDQRLEGSRQERDSLVLARSIRL